MIRVSVVRSALDGQIHATVPVTVNAAGTSIEADFNLAVAAAPVAEPRVPLIGNVTALPLFTAAQVRADLQAQLTSRVRWTESIHEMAARGVNTFVEIGSGQVLTGLIKRIDPAATCFNLCAPADFEKLP